MMKLKKSISVLVALATCIGLASCNSSNNVKENKVDEISILMGKPEVSAEFEEMLADYSENTGIKVTMIPLAGQDAYEKMTSLYAAGNAPNIMMVGQEFGEFQDKFLDLSDTEFVKKANEGTLDFVTVDGKVYGTPTTVEAYGIIYNPDTVKEALGEDVDPSSIRTQDELVKFFGNLEEAGVGAFTLTPEDWSLGAHLSNSVYAAQSEDHEERHKFFEDLKAGNVSLIDDSVFNGWVDLLDILLEHNVHKDNPLGALYEDNTLEIASGEVGTWFMGNWAYPDIAEIEEHDYAFIPLPLSNDSDDYANDKMAVGVPSYWVVDSSASTKEEQEASLDFLNWFLNTKEGQSYYVDKLNFIPAYEGFEVEPEDAMSKQIMNYLNEGNTLEWMNTYYPAGGFQEMGASMQKYIDGVIDREGLAKEFEDYWKSLNK